MRTDERLNAFPGKCRKISVCCKRFCNGLYTRQRSQGNPVAALRLRPMFVSDTGER